MAQFIPLFEQVLTGLIAQQLAAAGVSDPQAAQQQATQLAAALPSVIPGVFEGNRNGTATDDLTSLFAAAAARIPFGTVSPVQASDPTAVILAYRNFGDVIINGLDINLAYLPNDNWSLSGSYSYVSDDFFANLSGIADVALNAPRHKRVVRIAFRSGTCSYEHSCGTPTHSR